MSVRAQHVGGDEGVAGIGLALGGAVAGACGLERVRVNGRDGEPCVEQRVDKKARGALDEDGHLLARAERVQAADQLGDAVGRVGDAELCADLACGIDDTDVVLVAGPVDAAVVVRRESVHAVPPSRVKELGSGVGRSHRFLIDRRSGLQVPGRNTLWSVGAFLAGRGEQSHAGRQAARDAGSPPPGRRNLTNEVQFTSSRGR